MTTKENKNLFSILKKTGLTHQEFDKRLELALLEVEQCDTTLYPTMTSYFNNDYANHTVNDWLLDVPFQEFIGVCDRITEGTNCKTNRIILTLPGVVLMGDGDCPDCGGNCTETGYEESKGYGDGYHDPIEVSGFVEKKCFECGLIFNEEY
jgi:hypothetical protein